MAWDFEAFWAEYQKGECENVRCKNRHDALVELGVELRAYQSLVKRIQMRAKESDDRAACEIYVAVSNFNLGHRDRAAELPHS